MNRRSPRRVFFLAAISALCAGSIWAAPAPAALNINHLKVRAAIAVQNKATANLMKLPAVLGTAVGDDGAGGVSLIIFVEKGHPAAARVSAPPGSQIILTEKFRAGGPKPTASPGVSHTAKQSPPILLGTSGGWRNDLANGYCCGG